jgi:hypothetical protein
MITTIFTTFRVLSVLLLAISITLLFLALMQFVQTHLASVGWHKLASVSWNG